MDLLTTQQFASLAGTTRRTVHFYDEKDILKPAKVDTATGYRYYKPEQIIDFQAVLLLKTLNFSLDEIKAYLKTHISLKEMFRSKGKEIKQELKLLGSKLESVENFYENLEETGTLVNPIVKTVKPFEIYYIKRIGPYAKISSFFDELLSCLETKPKYETTVTLYPGSTYKPKEDTFLLGIRVEGIKIKTKYNDVVQRLTIQQYQCLSHFHKGSSNLLSLLWKSMEKYERNNKLKRDTKVPYLMEFNYRVRPKDFNGVSDFWFELQMPIIRRLP